MILPSGLSTTNYSISAAQKGWSAGWPTCAAINSGAMVKVKMIRSGTEFAGGVHRNIAELVSLICNEIERRGYRFVPGWCWGASCRAIAGTSRASNHSWGLAIDINAPNNPYTSSGVHDIPDWAFTLFRAYGFGVGADYTGKKDWMHMEFMGNVSDAATMTGLARKNITGGDTILPPPTGDDELSAAEVKQITDAIGGLSNKIQGMYNTMVEPQFQGQGQHTYRDETGWATDKVLVPAINGVQSSVGAVHGAVNALADRVEFIFYQDEGGIWEANIDAGTSWRLPTSEALATRQIVLTQAGRKWLDWPGGDVVEPSAFGRRNTADVAPAASPAAPATHTVAAGDSLSAIAKANGVTVQQLQEWNNIANPNDIAIGQVLRLGPQ